MLSKYIFFYDKFFIFRIKKEVFFLKFKDRGKGLLGIFGYLLG